MAKYLIINIAMPIWIGDDKNSHFWDFYEIEKEYKDKKIPFDENFDIYIYEVRYLQKVGYILVKHKYVKKDDKSNEATFEEVEIKENLFDLGNMEGLSALFKDVNAKDEKYKRKILVTWSHGFGYSMFNDRLTEDDLVIKFDAKEKLECDEYNTKNTPEIKLRKKDKDYNISYKLPQRPSILTMEELSIAISNANITFDAIVFSNCFMLTADTIYALQGNTSYIVGAETTFSWRSYQFGEFITKEPIEKESDFETYLLKLISNSLQEFPGFGDITKQVLKSQVSLSIIKTNEIYLFFNALQNIISFFIDHIEDDDDLHDDIKLALGYCTDVTGNYNNKAIDVNYFLDTFYKMAQFRYSTFENNYEFLKRFGFNNFYLTVNENKKDENKARKVMQYVNQNSGMSINFPPNPLLEEDGSYYKSFTHIDSAFQSHFSREMNWGLFLQILERMYS